MDFSVRSTMRGLFNQTLCAAITSTETETKRVFTEGVGKLVHGMNGEELNVLVAQSGVMFDAYPQVGLSVASALAQRFNEQGTKDRQLVIHQIDTMRQQEGLGRGLRTLLAIQSFKHNALNIFGR